MTTAKVGDQVRHRDGWTGVVLRVGQRVALAEIRPDGGSGPRWFNLEDFEPVAWDDLRQIVPINSWRGSVPAPTTMASSQDDLVRRYWHDAKFHQLVHYQRQLMKIGNSQQDLKDAADVAAIIDQDRRAAGDDVRERGQTDAQEERGTHETTE